MDSFREFVGICLAALVVLSALGCVVGPWLLVLIALLLPEDED